MVQLTLQSILEHERRLRPHTALPNQILDSGDPVWSEERQMFCIPVATEYVPLRFQRDLVEFNRCMGFPLNQDRFNNMLLVMAPMGDGQQAVLRFVS